MTLMAAGALLGGCGGAGKTDEERAQDALETFVAAVGEKDGAAICAALTPNAVRSVEKLAKAQKRPKAECADLVRGQLGRFLPPEGTLEVTQNREVSTGRRELVTPTLNGLTTAPFTLVQADGADDFRVALFAGDDLGDRLKRSAACSRLRQTTLRLPLPPSSIKGYPRHLRRVARQVSRRDRDLRDAYGAGFQGEALQGIAKALRSDARAIAAGKDVVKRSERADGRLQQVERAIAFVSGPGGRGTDDCGPDPHLSDRAKAYRKRMRAPCRRTSRVVKRENARLNANSSLSETTASVERVLRSIVRLNDATRKGELPDVLDAIRDAAVKDGRRFEAIVRDELAAFRALSLPQLRAVQARFDDLGGRADLAAVRLKLTDCLVPVKRRTGGTTGTSRA